MQRAHAVLGIPLDVFPTAALNDQLCQRRAGCDLKKEREKTGKSITRAGSWLTILLVSRRQIISWLGIDAAVSMNPEPAEGCLIESSCCSGHSYVFPTAALDDRLCQRGTGCDFEFRTRDRNTSKGQSLGV